MCCDAFRVDESWVGDNDFFQHRRAYLLPMIFYMLTQILVAYFLKTDPFFGAQNLFRFAGIVLLGIALRWENRNANYAIAGISLLVLVAYIATTDHIHNTTNAG